jgi:uncharacterized paraquat-inducible protein A
MLWVDEEMYMIAVLITLFSIIFPFQKLVSLSILWIMPRHTFCCRSYLRGLSYAGRFSLIDVFVVLILMVMAHD